LLRTLLAFCAGIFCCAADPQDLLTRIREHLGEYVSKLPDYTCRVTIERSSRRTGRSPFELTDRLRLEVAYTGGNELYAWPGSAAFERSIDELLPAHGMVSDGSYALHMRTLFLRNVAQFGPPKAAHGQVELPFTVPAVRSGYALTTSEGSVPAGLEGTLWLDGSTLDVERLDVRVETRLAVTAETTTYARARIGDVDFVVPQTSELILIDPGRIQLRNFSRFDDYHRFAGTSTVRYDAAPDSRAAASPAAPKRETAAAGDEIVAALDAEIAADAAIGDPFTVTAEGGAQFAGRVTGMRRVGRDQWNLELTLMGRTVRKTVRLPWGAGVKVVWKP
jgi:hypothetical protein